MQTPSIISCGNKTLHKNGKVTNDMYLFTHHTDDIRAFDECISFNCLIVTICEKTHHSAQHVCLLVSKCYYTQNRRCFVLDLKIIIYAIQSWSETGVSTVRARSSFDKRDDPYTLMRWIRKQATYHCICVVLVIQITKPHIRHANIHRK